MSKRSPGKLRIIGGQYRSRIVEFDAASDVRPTPDRVRQTLFDWLTGQLEGSHCLDLFAGSGALGLEALSRGAARVVFVDIRAARSAGIGGTLARLGAGTRGEVRTIDGLAYLAGDSRDRFDVVFLDPPFGRGLLMPALERLPRLLKPGNRVYFELEQGGARPLPDGYELLREKKAGQVSYGLATFNGISA